MGEILNLDTARKLKQLEKYKSSHDLLIAIYIELNKKINTFKIGQASGEYYTDSYKSKIEEDLEIVEIIDNSNVLNNLTENTQGNITIKKIDDKYITEHQMDMFEVD